MVKRQADPYISYLIPALVMGIIPHVMDLPPWITAVCFCSWFYILLGSRKNWPLIPRWLSGIFTVFAFSGIIIGSRGSFNSDSGISLLCLMASLKPFEIKGHRDRMITLFLAYFMVIAALFFSSSLEMTLYLYVSVTGITALLILVNNQDITLSRGFKLSLTITAQALPLSLILFLVFPRIQGSLWGIQTRSEGSAGLSDTLSPGSFSRLKQDNTLAFRVSFEPGSSPPSPLYWRARVFQNFNGKSWTVPKFCPDAENLPPSKGTVRYTVILEPHHQNYIPALDYPDASSTRFTLKMDNTLYSRERIIRAIRYDSVSDTETPDVPLTSWDWVYLRLPAQSNPRAAAFAQDLMARFTSVEQMVDSVLSYIRDQPFYYTLNTPELGANPVDTFLFQTRRGYCEHYASAFVFLMRSARIPSRIVGGYYGGERNPFGDYLMVRSKDAHAWAEVYMAGKGWVRVDPTAAIAPERVESDAASASAQNEMATDRTKNGGSFFSELVNRAKWGWDALNYQWYSRVIGFNTFSQRRFLESLGLSLTSLGGILKTLFLTIGLITGLLILYYLKLSLTFAQAEDPVKKGYRQFLKKLAAVGIIHSPSSGPVDFADMAIRLRRDLEKEIRGITVLYILLRYNDKNMDSQLMRDFLSQVRRFRPRRVKGR